MSGRAGNGVYALRYAHREASIRGEHFYGHDPDCHGHYPIDYYVWAVCRDEDVVLIDTGFSRATAERRGSRTYIDEPANLLRALGRTPADVKHLVLSHLHYDHAGCVADFPEAVVHVQKSELDFWTSDFAGRGNYPHFFEKADLDHLLDRQRSGTLQVAEGDVELDAAVSLHLVGGHTAGLQIVSVQTNEGPVVLATDASHFYENIESDRPYGIVHSLPPMYAAFDTLRRLAGPTGTIVPGHDPRVRERYSLLPANDNIVTLGSL